MTKAFLSTSWSKLLPALGLAVFAVSNSYGLTIITNDGFTQNNQSLPDTLNGSSSYGSNTSASNTSSNWTIATGVSGVEGTPDIALIWESQARLDTYTNWDGRGNVVQLDSNGKASHIFNITFVPSGSVAVNVGSFDLDAWSGATGGIDLVVNWSLTNLDGSEVYSSGVFTEPAASGGRSTISTNYTGLTGQSLVLRMEQVQGAGDYLAFDNLTFDQVAAVPEPSTVAFILIGAGFGVVIFRRRRFEAGCFRI